MSGINKFPGTLSRLSCVVCVAIGCSVAGSASAAGFLEDSQATLRLRNLYYDNDFRSGHGAGGSRLTEWGQGFILNARSGYTEGTVGFGADVTAFYGLKLDSGGKAGDPNSSRQPAILFPRESDESSVDDFSWAYLNPKIRVSKTEIVYGAHQPRMPIVQASTGSIAPQLFEGTMITSREIDDLLIIAGMFDKSKGRASSDGISMSINAANPGRRGYASPANVAKYGASIPGTPQDSNKFWFFGSEYTVDPSLTLRYYYAQMDDFYSQHMVGALTQWRVGDGVLSGDFRHYDSSGHGKNRSFDGQMEGYLVSGFYANDVTLGEVDNQLTSALFSYKYGAHTFGAGYQHSEGDSDFVWPNQGDGSIAPITSDIQVNKFARAGERTWQVRYGYDFTALGVPGLNLNWIYLKGSNALSAEGPKKEQVQIVSMTYAVQQGGLKGLAFRLDQGKLKTEMPGARDMTETRLTTEYSIPLR
ncbi:OprD family porin [Pseudomonas sp. 5P_3.1_Bac2]|uniref:OprD family porin n=1 Tax=Pseudomonas sp. 5P_3.1_Bac2 TaxID=2971617 RepID=UPI0021CA2C43|nr:OprD family porin [Pseudomonas sp. 5P_3.1_Bac2]MCU1719511.1 OprD family porin [Pseudomonas sp. 5P_3.1_Bac2]